MNAKRLCALLISLSGFAGLSVAQDLLYRCKVKQVMELSGEGVLKSIKVYGLDSAEFFIDRETGEIKGAFISTKHSIFNRVVDVGGRAKLGNNFKVTGVIENLHPTVFYFEVHDMLYKQEYEFSGFYKYWHLAGICK